MNWVQLTLLTSMLATLTVTTVNVRSIQDHKKRADVFSHISSLKSDIICIQECNLPHQQHYTELQQEWRFGGSVWSGSNIARADGVAILLRNPNIKIISTSTPVPGRLITATLKVNNSIVKIINVYAPTNQQERLTFFSKLRPVLLGNLPVVVAGDFNCALREEDRSRPRNDRSSRELASIIDEFALTDAGRDLVPHYTWVSSDGTSFSRIDLLLFSHHTTPINTVTAAVFFSDHRQLTTTFTFPAVRTKGKGLWKLNTLHLENKQTVTTFTEKFNQWSTLLDSYDSPIEWWEMVKERTKHFFITAGKIRARQDRQQYTKLNNNLQRLTTLQLTGFNLTQEIAETKHKLAILYRKEQNKLKHISKVKHMEQDEKCTTYFFKKIRNKQDITHLKDSTGTITQDEQQIRNITQRFYTDLYAETPTDPSLIDIFLSHIHPLTEDQRTEYEEGGLCVEELTLAVNSFSVGKTPGPDGLPAEFYQKFWPILQIPLTTVFHSIFTERRLAPSMQESAITLLYKGKGDQAELKHWRPISLLGVDYKILSKTLMYRFQRPLPVVVGPDQSCGVPGRSPADNLTLIRDIMAHSVERSQPFCLFNLDQEKAFDRVSHSYMLRVLDAMNLPLGLRSWVKTIYSNNTSKVLVNHQPTKSFPVKSGVRQGCPLSAILYTICLEPLLQTIRDHPRILGYPIPGAKGTQVKVQAYMDDVTILCTQPHSVPYIIATLDSFCTATGTIINRAKSEVYASSSWRVDPVLSDTFPVRRSVKILGVVFDGTNSGAQSWTEAITKVQNKICSWKGRTLTTAGKVLITKAILYPILAYIGKIYPPDQKMEKKINKVIFSFIWGGGQERVKRLTMFKCPENGGRDVPNIPVMVRVQSLAYTVSNIQTMAKKSSFFNKFYFTTTLRPLGLCALDHTIPYSWDPPKHYRVLRETLHAFFKNKTDNNWTFKTLKTAINQLETPIVLEHPPNFDNKIIWKNVNNPNLSNKHKDIAWMAAVCCLPTRVFMFRRGLAQRETCPYGCPTRENETHVLWECRVAKDTWLVTSPLLQRLTGPAAMTLQDVFYGPPEGAKTPQHHNAWRVINAVKQVLWDTRNICLFQKQELLPIIITRTITNTILDYISLDLHRLGKDVTHLNWNITGLKDITLHPTATATTTTTANAATSTSTTCTDTNMVTSHHPALRASNASWAAASRQRRAFWTFTLPPPT